jgi:hypothetical protein
MPLVRLTAGVGQVDHDLRTLDPPCGAGVLALHPDRGGALLQVPGLIDHQDPARLAEPGHHPVPHVTQHPIRIPRRRGQQPLHPPRAGLTGMLQQFVCGSPAIIPSTKRRNRNRGSTLHIRAATQPRRSSSSASQRPGSTLWPAATVRSSSVHTTKILERWPRSILDRHARYVTKCRCRTRGEPGGREGSD